MPLAVHDVELGLLERGRALVLHDLDARAVADDLGAVLDRLDTTDVESDRRVELERPPTGRDLGRAVDDADLLTQLVDEDREGVGLRQPTGQLAQRLTHQTSLESDVGVTHVAFDLGPRRQRRDRVDDDDVERARADQHVGDLEGLLAGVGLGDEQVVDVDADGARVDRVHGVLGVDVGTDATVALRLGDHVHGQGRLTRGLGTVELDDATAGQPPIPSAMSRASAPVGIDSMFMCRFSPMRMIEPLPNCFSIWPSAASRALARSSVAITVSLFFVIGGTLCSLL
jgi:hypothetical protein